MTPPTVDDAAFGGPINKFPTGFSRLGTHGKDFLL